MGTVLGGAFSGVFANWRVMGAGLGSLALGIALLNYATDLMGTGATANELFGLLSILSIFTVLVFTDYAAWDRLRGERTHVFPTLGRAAVMTVPIALLITVLFATSYIGSIFFIVPGVIISIGWAVIGPAFLHEAETSILGAFGRSWRLGRGYRGWVWLSQIIMNVVIILLASLIYGVADATVPRSLLDQGTYYVVIDPIFTIIPLYSLAALYASYTTALYAHLRSLHQDDPTEMIAGVFD